MGGGFGELVQLWSRGTEAKTISDPQLSLLMLKSGLDHPGELEGLKAQLVPSLPSGLSDHH